MVVIGIDPGTATTGYGVVKENKEGELQAVDYGVISTPANTPMSERLLKLHNELQKIILLHQPEEGAVEKLFFQKNVKTAITVAQGRGVAILALAQAKLTVSEYTPMEIKQAITGYGKASKQQIQQMVRMLLQLEEIPKPDDAADALAVAICHHHSVKTQTWYR